MKRSSATTLQDIAREAGVTAMTVSVVLNGATSSTRVSETTRRRITEVADRLRYRPNAVARGLSRRRMNTVGVCASIDGLELNLYFLEVLNGILEANSEHGQNTTIFSVNDWVRDESKLLSFCDGRVDGMICIAPCFSPAFAETLRLLHTPFVTLHSNTALPQIHNLAVDDFSGAYTITQHLIGLGHRHILHLAGSGDLSGACARVEGYRQALLDAGLPFVPERVVACGYSISSGRTHTAALLDHEPPEALPTAIFCANDAIAYGCWEALTSRGVRIPQEISLAGFDDMLSARMTFPALTTMRQPFRLMGHVAVERLLPQIETVSEGADSPPPDFSRDSFPLELVVRGSSGPPPPEK